MKRILAFNINQKQFIEVYCPDIKNKINYFYKPTEKLHKFDEVRVDYQTIMKRINLCENVLDIALYLRTQLKKAKTGNLELSSLIAIGQLVYCLNESDKDNAEEKYMNIDFSNYWVWSTTARGAQTFMYTRNTVLYLEIGLGYKWNRIQPKKSDTDYIPYEEFIKNYKPILVQEVTDEMAQDWLNQCETIMKKIEINE